MRRFLLIAFILTSTVFAAEKYQKPPKEVLDVLNAPPTPTASISPARDAMLLVSSVPNPPIADLAQPMLRIAGVRIDPKTNSPHAVRYFVGLTLVKLPAGTETKISVPANARLSTPVWSADGKHFAFANTNTAAGAVELWLGTTATGAVHRVPGVAINSAIGGGFGGGGGGRGGFGAGGGPTYLQWLSDNKTLLVLVVPAGRGKAPAAPIVPEGPDIQESSGAAAGAVTFEDLLKNAHDEDLFEYYATAQAELLNTATGQAAPVGKPAIFESLRPSPDGKLFLVARAHRPFSYLYPHSSFPKEVEVWDRTGKVVYKLASLPLEDKVAQEGVATGPRQYQWRPTDPATLVWAEALDGGDPRSKITPRDKVLMLKAPFKDAPVELVKTEQRFQGLQWGEKDGVVLVRDYERARRWNRTYLLNADNPSEAPKLIWSLDSRDRYKDPGRPVMRAGERAILQNGEFIYLAGEGASARGDHPFLDRFSLKTLKSERLFECDSKSYEVFEALLDDDASRFITRHESPSEPPNFFIRGKSGEPVAVTKFPDPAPQLRSIHKELVKYKRPDGVDLSFTLYLPPNYKEGTRLPTVVWAYPLEYEDARTAGQVSGSTNRFTMIAGMSHLFFLLEGYAVLDNATMPVVGSADKVNDTYVDQVVSSAQAAIDKAVSMGVTDPDRVGVGGHSYGAFMTMNLLAHSRLFRAGIARSGAYNRTLTPFGFQSERRTLWEAPQTYLKMSPFMYADKIKDPVVMIHGEADDNTGTFPIQSERMYQAIRGNKGVVRLVMLPFEPHGYTGRESIEHVLYEMITWFDKYVKNAAPRTERSVGGSR